MEETIEERRGDDGVAEDLAPLAKPRFEVRIMVPFS
jgi:hypothetical protein